MVRTYREFRDRAVITRPIIRWKLMKLVLAKFFDDTRVRPLIRYPLVVMVIVSEHDNQVLNAQALKQRLPAVSGIWAKQSAR